MPEFETISKYDRQYGGLLGGQSLSTKPSTIEHVDNFTGKTETFVIQTIRDEDGDHISVKRMDVDGNIRMILPPKVASVIASQSGSLTTKRRRIAGKARAKADKEKGILPGFMRIKKGGAV
jgi:hypothetical protein